MSTKIVFQTNSAGLFCGVTEADESPLEPGVFHIPAGAVTAPPPAEWPDAKWPRWNGSAWQLVTKPKPPQPGLWDRLVAAIEAFKQGGV